MRGSRWFIFFVLAFLLADVCRRVSSAEESLCGRLPFSHYDEQPLGCAVFDSLLTVFPAKSGYSICREGDVLSDGAGRYDGQWQ